MINTVINIKHTAARTLRAAPSVLLSILTLMGIASVRADAYDFTGRISSDFYAYRGASDDHLRPYLRFQGNMLAWRGSDGRSLELHTSLRWTTDFADELPGDPSLFVYDAYVHLRNLPPRTDLYIGRQFVYTGAGSALMDGARIQYRPLDKLRFEVFGGSSVSSEDPENIRSVADDLVTGAHITVRPARSTNIGASWMLRRHKNEESYHRVGVDAAQYFGAAEVYGRVSYNAADSRLADILARAVYRPGAWYVSGEYLRREPSVPANSIFSLIDFETYQIGRVEARRRVWRRLSVLARVQADLTTGDDSWRTGLGFGTPLYSLSWIHQTGRAGDNDGVSGHMNLRLSNQWDCFASANLYRYRVQLEQRERSDAYAASAGARWRPGYGITIRAEAQYLRNAVLMDDGRIYFQIAKDFSTKDVSTKDRLPSSEARPDNGRRKP